MSRNKILQAVKANRPATLPLPALPSAVAGGGDYISLFVDRLHAAGGTSLLVGNKNEALQIIREKFPAVRHIASSLPEVDTVSLTGQEDPHQLAELELAVFKGRFAVAENGAIWLDEQESMHRVASFIPLHLALLVPANAIYPSMHEAYQAIDGQDYGYGVFISGPSKTADIEQSLVIGAHGPRSLLALILNEDAQSSSS